MVGDGDGDGGGKAPQWKPVIGAEKVARVLAAIVPPFVRIGGVVEPRQVNGHPGAIFRDRDGKVLNTLALDILDGRIQTIRSVINPDKRHLGQHLRHLVLPIRLDHRQGPGASEQADRPAPHAGRDRLDHARSRHRVAIGA